MCFPCTCLQRKNTSVLPPFTGVFFLAKIFLSLTLFGAPKFYILTLLCAPVAHDRAQSIEKSAFDDASSLVTRTNVKTAVKWRFFLILRYFAHSQTFKICKEILQKYKENSRTLSHFLRVLSHFCRTFYAQKKARTSVPGLLFYMLSKNVASLIKFSNCFFSDM